MAARFGKYELVSLLAKGGMGETYLAELQALAGVTKRVVIKKMLPALAADPKLVEAFIQEARLSATLSHGNIAQVFDFGEVDGEYFIAMEHVHGRSLQQLVKRAGAAGWERLPTAVSVFVVIELLKALHHAHTRVGPDGAPLNLVHRDITPDNVLISYEGAVKLVDFGVAKAALRGRAETEPGLVKGKYRYLSPEQATGRPLDARSDLFTVGIVLHELLSGAQLFATGTLAAMSEIVHGEVPPLPPHVPEALAAIVTKALSTDREARHESALELQAALSRWLFTESPELSGEVVRELMGELFEAELAAEGIVFRRKKKATQLLTALKRPVATQLNTAVRAAPGARTFPWPLVAAAAAVAVLVGLGVFGGLYATRVKPLPVEVVALTAAAVAEPALPEPEPEPEPALSPPKPRVASRPKVIKMVAAETLGKVIEVEQPPAAKPSAPAKVAPREHWTMAATWRLDSAREYFNDGRYRQAIEQLGLCLGIDRRNAECLLLMGDSLWAMESRKSGAKRYLEFLEVAPNHDEAPRVRQLLKNSFY
ncbi:MAG: serine/threonine protein kinase [Myxococcaceae bacterium]|nr:serine/threonine protein kinase [Myxococcaceae bacterium]